MFQVTVNEFLGWASTRGADGTRPAANEGTAVTPGTGGTMGSYANLGVLSATYDVHEIEIVVHTVTTAGSNRMVALDLAYDPAGGTAFGNLISDLQAGSPGGITGGLDNRWTFPVRIPAGASLGVRAVSLDATVTAIRVFVDGKFQPTRPDLIRVGSFVQTFGVPVSGTPAGTAIVPGTVSDGAWVEVGTLTKPLHYFELGYQIDDTTMTTGQINIDVALGDATNKRIIIPNFQIATSANETLVKKYGGRFARGAIGDKIYARAQFSGTPDSANTIAVYGVG